MDDKLRDRLHVIPVLCLVFVFGGAFYLISNELIKIEGTNLLVRSIQIIGYFLTGFAFLSTILRLIVGKPLSQIPVRQEKRLLLCVSLLSILLGTVECLLPKLSQSDVKKLAAEFGYILGEYFIYSDNDGLLESLENNDWEKG